MSMAVAGRQVEVTVTDLVQDERPNWSTTAKPPGAFALLRAERPPLHFYRYLYDLVGRRWNWSTRKLLSDDAVLAIIHDPNVHVYALYANGSPAGFSEIDARREKLAEIRFFGLTPEWIGTGLGRFFLTNIVERAWSLGPSRVQLETCTLDHPAALPLYQKLGFRVFDRRAGYVTLLDQDSGAPQ
jgi:GNAT superfamily N-acetyltransferase